MAVEYFDSEQGKPIEELEETMILSDETSYFLVSMENITRKINLLSLIKMMAGDENGTNSEYKFYSTQYLDSKVSEIYQSINDMGSHFDKYTEMIEQLRTKIDSSISSFQNIVNQIDPKLEDLEVRLQELINKTCSELAQEHVTINNKIDSINQAYQEADSNILNYVKEQFQQLFQQIEEGGDISDQMFAVLQASIDQLRLDLSNIKKTLDAKDTELEQKITELENRLDDIDQTVNNEYYSKTEMDDIINDIYKRIKVQVISANKDSAGRAQNLNNYTNDGLYFFTASASASNLPSGCTNGILWTINCGDGPTPTIKQLFFRYGTVNKTDHNIFTRTRMTTSATWSSWARILTTNDIKYGTSVPTNLETGQIYLQYFV